MVAHPGHRLHRHHPWRAAGIVEPGTPSSVKSIQRALVAFVLLIAAAGMVGGQPPTRGPIKVGFLVPLSGANAQNGRDILNGFLLYLEEIGYRAGGRPIQLIVEDDEAIPAVGLTKARKLIERDKVHVMA